MRTRTFFVVDGPDSITRRLAMYTFARRSAVLLVLFLLLPAAAFAQAAITGIVKDASGAVLRA